MKSSRLTFQMSIEIFLVLIVVSSSIEGYNKIYAKN